MPRTLVLFPSIHTRTGFVQIQLLLEWRDVWVGVFWKRYPRAVEVFVCFVPFLPISVYWQWNMR